MVALTVEVEQVVPVEGSLVESVNGVQKLRLLRGC